jgi:hypothetical protein
MVCRSRYVPKSPLPVGDADDEIVASADIISGFANAVNEMPSPRGGHFCVRNDYGSDRSSAPELLLRRSRGEDLAPRWFGFRFRFRRFLGFFSTFVFASHDKSMTQTSARGKSKSLNCAAAVHGHSGSKGHLPRQFSQGVSPLNPSTPPRIDVSARHKGRNLQAAWVFLSKDHIEHGEILPNE